MTTARMSFSLLADACLLLVAIFLDSGSVSWPFSAVYSLALLRFLVLDRRVGDVSSELDRLRVLLVLLCDGVMLLDILLFVYV